MSEGTDARVLPACDVLLVAAKHLIKTAEIGGSAYQTAWSELRQAVERAECEALSALSPNGKGNDG